MNPELTAALVAGSVTGVLWTALWAAVNRPVSRPLLSLLAVLEVLLLAQLVVGVVSVLRGGHPVATATFVAYLVGVLLLLPAGVFWSVAERSRAGMLVLTVACFSVAVMVGRLYQIWNARG